MRGHNLSRASKLASLCCTLAALAALGGRLAAGEEEAGLEALSNAELAAMSDQDHPPDHITALVEEINSRLHGPTALEREERLALWRARISLGSQFVARTPTQDYCHYLDALKSVPPGLQPELYINFVDTIGWRVSSGRFGDAKVVLDIIRTLRESVPEGWEPWRTDMVRLRLLKNEVPVYYLQKDYAKAVGVLEEIYAYDYITNTGKVGIPREHVSEFARINHYAGEKLLLRHRNDFEYLSKMFIIPAHWDLLELRQRYLEEIRARRLQAVKREIERNAAEMVYQVATDIPPTETPGPSTSGRRELLTDKASASDAHLVADGPPALQNTEPQSARGLVLALLGVFVFVSLGAVVALLIRKR